MVEWVFIFVLFAAAWFWFESLRVREIATAVTKQFCTAQGLQFLDGAVGFISLKLGRDKLGRLALAITYRFEFSDSGDNRLFGTVTMFGRLLGPMHMESFHVESQ